MLVLSCYACRYDKYEQVEPAKEVCLPVLPDSVSFSKHIIPLLNKNCNTSGCHSGLSPEGKLNLEPAVAYSKLSKKGSGYIDTINPKNSVLYSAVVSASNPMPPTGRLDDCSIELIYKWMQQKGKNN